MHLNIILYKEITNELLQEFAIPAKDKQAKTVAALKANKEMVELLVRAGANVNHVNDREFTVLKAAETGGLRGVSDESRDRRREIAKFLKVPLNNVETQVVRPLTTGVKLKSIVKSANDES